ncbi:O-antigen polymerase [Pusillimonas noertemannii]|uniref:Oligosaccharide repeat unit polymerase n=1 Tax=Pusillimonas noertemannii TaxID=305977 RepID=A0A2U1CPP5_9BURK|nr:O-antigen polymerase [Pusillimonas noertemannii]NYT67182.1 oligosaccharide repeat unit polymerase [Pusillimonas noertemannii]PVY67860.1 oligosaccharide repeat unit polymerase [Pusillimonas noertemannii]
MLFEPRFLFIFLWTAQGLGYFILGAGFDQFATTTWALVLLAVVAFFIGGTVGSHIPVVSIKRESLDKFGLDSIRLFATLVFPIYIAVACLSGLEFLHALSVATDHNLTPSSIRLAVILDFLGPRDFSGPLRVFYFGVGLCIYLLAYARRFSRWVIALIFLVGLLSAVATTGRLYLLLFFISTITLFYRQRIVSIRTVLTAGIGFVCIFFLLALIFKKGAESADTILGMLEWNAKVYLLSSLGCFNDYIVSGNQYFDNGLLIPNPLRNLINTILDFHIPAKPPLYPFTEVPVFCNTYTILYPIHNDLGALGVATIMSLLGIFHSYLFRLQTYSSSPTVWYFFSLSLYPLMMSVFEDAYFSSMGFWILLWIPPTLHYIFHSLLKSFYSSPQA